MTFTALSVGVCPIRICNELFLWRLLVILCAWSLPLNCNSHRRVGVKISIRSGEQSWVTRSGTVAVMNCGNHKFGSHLTPRSSGHSDSISWVVTLWVREREDFLSVFTQTPIPALKLPSFSPEVHARQPHPSSGPPHSQLQPSTGPPLFLPTVSVSERSMQVQTVDTHLGFISTTTSSAAS